MAALSDEPIPATFTTATDMFVDTMTYDTTAPAPWLEQRKYLKP